MAVNFEHTGVDGHTVLRFVSDVYTDTVLRFAKSINGKSPSIWNTHSPDPHERDPASFGDVSTTPRKLEWNTTPDLLLAMRFGETRLADLIEQNEFQVLEFNSYGQTAIKQMGFSPDAYVQMSFQAAYYSLYGGVECTYEPAMTKQFLHGRTESIRTASRESAAFVRKFCEDAPASQKIDFLRKACQRHSRTTAKCSKGIGQDRHLYALFCIWKRYVEESMDDTHSDDSNDELLHMPSIFSDPGWDKLGNAILSTSNCGNMSLKLFGFGPTSSDGFGLGYIIKGESITICASSKHRQTQRFLDTLNTCLLEFRNLWRTTELASGHRKLSMGTRARSYDNLAGMTTPHFGKSLTPNPALIAQDEESSQAYLLGGYGYFDMGEYDYSRAPSPPESSGLRRRLSSKKEIGGKLRFAES